MYDIIIGRLKMLNLSEEICCLIQYVWSSAELLVVHTHNSPHIYVGIVLSIYVGIVLQIGDYVVVYL